MSDYKERLEVAKKTYVVTEGVGECGVRLAWCIRQVGHSYTNMGVEDFRVLFPKMKQEAFCGKDWAYVIGHITQFLVLPTIVCEILVQRRIKKQGRWQSL